jgi:hypothetical protein
MLYAAGLGAGKSMTAQTIAYMCHRRGSLILTMDPKPDHRLHEMEELDVEVVELSGAERFRGLLDPLQFATQELKEDLTVSYVMELLNNDDFDTMIRRAVRTVIEEDYDPRLTKVAQLLLGSQSPDERKAGEALETWSGSSGVARLAFSDPGTTPQIGNRSIITFRAPDRGGLNLPTPATPRSSYSQSERLAVATLQLVATYCVQMASDADRHALVLLDEAWALLRSTAGRSLIDRLLRLGRSQQATLLLVTQSVSDLAQETGELANLIGVRLVGRCDSEAEAVGGLKLLGIDSEDPVLVERIMSYPEGLCLMRDVDKHVAEVQIDPGELLDRLSTTVSEGNVADHEAPDDAALVG